MLPPSVSHLVLTAPACGFSGTRHGCPLPLPVVESLTFLAPVSAVGCARGVDQAFRSALPSPVVFRASGRLPWQLVSRSVECVQWVASRGGLWVSVPSSPCPAGVLPSASSSRCFSGGGSGSWASLAFALGSGCSALVFLGSLPCPAGFGLSSLGGGWWFAGGGGSSQLSLF